MKVLVVGQKEACPATFALRSELIEYDFISVPDDFAYGRMLHKCWEERESFISMEHDIVPWFGAVKALYQCDYGFCTYQYPVGHSGKLQTALGLVKFSKDLIEDHPDANFGWDRTLWNHLDAQVYGALQIDRKISPHIHTPPVAHLKPFEAPTMNLSQVMARCR